MIDISAEALSGAASGLKARALPDGWADGLASGLGGFLNHFTDRTRLLSLQLDAGMPAGTLTSSALLVGRLRGTEQLSECYAFEVECYSADATIRPEQLLGRRVSVALHGGVSHGSDGVTGALTSGLSGSLSGGLPSLSGISTDKVSRWFNGVIQRVVPRQSDGGMARIDLTVVPHFALLGIGRVARTYQELSVPDILDAELSRWQAALPDLQWRFDLSATYPVRSYTVFHRETALAACQRLAAEEGIGFYFEHLAPSGEQVGLQTLVFFDAVGALPANAQNEQRFHRASALERSDAIDRWQTERSVVPGSVALQAWEYKSVASLTADLPSQLVGSADDNPAANLTSALADYAPQTQNYGSGSDDLDRYARLRLEALEAHAAPANGAGSVRSAQPGTAFSLTNHHAFTDTAGEGANRFVFVKVEHDARNNLPADLLKGIQSNAPSTDEPHEAGYRNQFVATSANQPWRPAFDHTRHAKPPSPGPQPAIVVGPPGVEIHTDELGRIQVQFPWDADGLSTCWLRVVTPIAGAGWGHIHLPRVGQEVLVDFVQNDIDRPVVIGSLFNGTHTPPRFSDAGAYPANRALSGYRSSEVGGTGYGELLFDDSTGQTKTKLSSELGKTQLNQGWIGHPRFEGESHLRGTGFELRTDLTGAIRAAQGLLLSADARPQATGATLDRQELIGQLEVALSLARKLAELSTTHEAGGTDTQAQADLLQAIQGWTKAPQADAPNAAVIAASAPAGIALASGQSVTASAGTNIDLAAAQDANVSTGRKLMLRAAQGLSAFAHKAGMQLIAAAGKLSLQAHADGIEIGAAKRLHQYSLDSVLIEAPKILLKTAGAQLALDESGITLSASGAVQGHAASFNFSGGGGGGISLPGMPASSMGTDERYVVRQRGSGRPKPNQNYRIELTDGRVITGQTDEQGRTSLMADEATRIAKITLLNPS